jgi:hypothetical protein
MKRKKPLSQSPIEMVLVSYVTTKKEQDKELFLYAVCRQLCQTRTNISFTIMTNIENIPKNILSHRRMTIIKTNDAWIHYATAFIHSMPRHVDYCLLTTPRFSSILWLYARLLGAKSIYMERGAHHHVYTKLPRYIASIQSRLFLWTKNQYDLITRLPKKQKIRTNTIHLAESLYLHIYHHCTLETYKRGATLRPSFS